MVTAATPFTKTLSTTSVFHGDAAYTKHLGHAVTRLTREHREFLRLKMLFVEFHEDSPFLPTGRVRAREAVGRGAQTPLRHPTRAPQDEETAREREGGKGQKKT